MSADTPKPTDIARVVALGASNLSLGLQTVTALSRAAWGPDIELLVAAGYGRSYGARSSIPFRSLPGILQCALWEDLDRLPAATTRALVTDIGNDILYGATAPQILEWVEEAVDRLARFTTEVRVTRLPAQTIHALSPAAFLLFRSVFYPPCRLSRLEVSDTVDAVNAGLDDLAKRKGLSLLPPPPDWYGVDPIHFRPSRWKAAWRAVLLDPSFDRPSPFSAIEWARLHTLPPQRRWLAGFERLAPQTGRRLRRGGGLRLY